MKTIYLILFTVILSFGCSKQKMTTSKIKLSGGNILSGTLGTRASNGLIIYGKSTDGKSFLKKIDNSTVDMEFPNGIWNFYSVAWENATPNSAFEGTVHCGKSENINLSGTDTTINLSLSNANCNDGAFASIRGGSTTVVFPTYDFASCKDINPIAGMFETAKCDRTLNNRGFATYIKVLIPQYKKFGSNLEDYNVNMQSACIKMSDTLSVNLPAATPPGTMISPGQLNLPDSINGFQKIVKVYYSSTDARGCDDTDTPDEIVLPQEPTPRTKLFSYSSGSIAQYRVFFQANEPHVCQGTRLATTYDFAGGYGTANAPFVICNKQQFDRINANWVTNSSKSFELASDLNFGLQSFVPVGDSASMLSASNSFSGNFYGNNKRLENIKISCGDLSGNSSLADIGLFRKSNLATFQDFVINRLVIDCEKTQDFVGGVVGNSTDTNFKNIKVFGHISGGAKVGMIAGTMNITGSFAFTSGQLHTYGGIEGRTAIGGIFGGSSNSSTVVASMSEVSSFIQIHAQDGSTASNSSLGGVGGYSYNYSPAFLNITNAVLKIKSMEGDMYMGGMFGETERVNISDSYVSGLISQSKYTDGSTYQARIGGLIGQANNGSITNTIAIVQKIPNKSAIDTTMGGNIGKIGTSPACTSSYYNGEYDPANNTGCNDSSAKYKTLPQLILSTTYSGFSSSIWEHPDDNYDIPRLKFEANVENQISYLKRPCTGLYVTPSGSGTLSDPYSICSWSQFYNMSSGPHYKLKRNLVLGGSDITPFQLAPGIYHLDGDGNSIINFSLNHNNSEKYGLFKELLLGSYIKNLGIVASSLSSNNIAVSTTDQYVGILAGLNSGLIENVNLEQSSLEIKNYSRSGSSSTAIGGLVGYNTTTGQIKNSKIRLKYSLFNPNAVPSTYLVMGGAVGKNSGLISGIRFNGDVNRNIGHNYQGSSSTAPFTCDTGHVGYYYYNTSTTLYYNCNGSAFNQAYPIAPTEIFGGIVGYNDSPGIIKEIEFDGSFSLHDSVLNTDGIIGPVVAYNSGTISDLVLKINIDNTRTDLSSLVGIGGGSFTRALLKFRNTPNGFVPSTSPFPSGFTQSLCLDNSIVGCYASSTASLSYDTSANKLTFMNNGGDISGLVDMTSWSVATDFFSRGNATWLIEGNINAGVLTKNIDDDLPRLAKTEGSFEELGIGF